MDEFFVCSMNVIGLFLCQKISIQQAKTMLSTGRHKATYVTIQDYRKTLFYLSPMTANDAKDAYSQMLFDELPRMDRLEMLARSYPPMTIETPKLVQHKLME